MTSYDHLVTTAVRVTETRYQRLRRDLVRVTIVGPEILIGRPAARIAPIGPAPVRDLHEDPA